MIRLRAIAVPFALFLGLAACSGGGPSGPGEVSVVLTDAASDELDSFEVDVSNIVFTRLGGSTVSVLARATRVDFTELETLAELVAGGTLAAGYYTGVSMTLDFTNAVVTIAGNTSPAAVLDKDGNPLTGTVDVQVGFAAGARPFISARSHMFVLDLDLEQSLTIDTGANTVTFCPVLSAALDPTNPKPVATTGILESVDLGTASFGVERRALDGNTIGVFAVRTTGTTVFQIDGNVALGTAGLTALAGLAAGTDRVWVQGTVDPVQRVLNAFAVEAGAGVFGNGQSWVLGHVIARDNGAGSDATLTVLGRSRDGTTGTRLYNTPHTINVSVAQTRVLRRGAGNTLDADALNVGQLVLAFGDLTGTVLDAAGTDGVVRMLRTSIFGIATGAPAANVMTLDVTRFDLRDESLFGFTVGGSPEADPDNFTVDVTGLDTTGITTGTKVRVFGFVNAVGNASDANSQAAALIQSSAARVLFCQWSPASSSAIAATTAISVTLDVNGTVISAVGDGFAPVAVNPTPAPTILPLTLLGIYRIVQGSSVEVHLGFDAFRQSLAVHAALGNVFRIAAFGTYDDATQVFRALTVTVVMD
jgi:hypothetical protein